MNASYERRLPVYLLLDCSESMIGDGMEALQRGLSGLMMDLHSDPQALETVWVSVITFSDHARQVLPLTELSQVRIPPLTNRPGTALGEALTLLRESIQREVRTHSAAVKGDWKPMVFLMTDGNPTDRWEAAAAQLRAASGRQPMNIIAISCGDESDPYVLMQVAQTVLRMDERPESFRALFQWISASLSVTSHAIAGPTPGPISLEKLPEELSLAKADAPRPQPRMQSQVFMAMRCSNTRRPYLVRYRLSEEHEAYEPVRTHPVDESYFEGTSGTDASLAISSAHLMGILPCPHCHNDSAGRCQCGQLFCAGDDPDSVTCPGCRAELTFGGPGGGNFQISGRLG